MTLCSNLCPFAKEVLQFRWLLIGIIATGGAILGINIPYINIIIIQIVRPIIAFAKYLLVTIAGLVSFALLIKITCSCF